MTTAFFITGTDTGVGKTHVACELIRYYVGQGLKVVGMKPVAAGCEWVNGQVVNEDVARLSAVSNVQAPAEWINPYCFNEPIAPHLAAEMAGVVIDMAVIQQAFNQLTALADVVIVEGAGGFLVPINASESFADLAVALQIPVILVVGMRLGCINHSLLTYEAIQARKLRFHGWVANHIDPEMPMLEQNIAMIAKQLSQPPIFTYSWQL